MKTFNRIVGWDDLRGIIFEADPRHADIIFSQLKFGDANAASTPGIKEECATVADCHEALNEEQTVSLSSHYCPL